MSPQRVTGVDRVSQLVRFGVSMGGDLLKRFDDYISRRKYVNRSDAVRDLV